MGPANSTADDQDIVRIAKEVIEELGISSFRPVSVSWTDELPWTLADSESTIPELTGIVKRNVPIGWCVFTWDRVLLPTGMKGKLDPEEWRPLLASSLIYESKLKTRRDLGVVLVSTPVIIDGLGWLELFAVSTPEAGIPALLFVLDFVGLFAAFFLMGFMAKWFSKRLRLRADTLATEHVGREALGRVLEKMEALGLADEYAGLRFNGFTFSSEIMSGRPTLAERIMNLKRNSRVVVEN